MTLRTNFEEYSELFNKLKLKLGQVDLPETEISNRRQAIKEITDTYNSLKRQLDNTVKTSTYMSNTTDEDFQKPLSRDEYYKLKEEKLKSKMGLILEGDEALDIISGTTKIIKNNAHEIRNVITDQNVKLGTLETEVKECYYIRWIGLIIKWLGLRIN
jgi:hypothetical protein